MLSFIENPFLLTALWASFLAAIAAGTIGSFVVIKRIAFIAGSVSHSVLGGMAFCLWLQRSYGLLWASPLIGAFAAAVLSALLIGWIHLNYRQREDAVIAAIWSTGMAIGVILLSLTPGTNVELMNFLFGNILWVSSSDLALLALLDGAILVTVALYYQKFLALCFDEEQALLQGVAVRRLYLLLLSLTAVSVVLLIQIIGTILVIALLTLPAMLASLFTKRLHLMIGAASAIAAVLSLVGLNAAYLLDWPPGATIALSAALAYLAALGLRRRRLFKLFLNNGKS